MEKKTPHPPKRKQKTFIYTRRLGAKAKKWDIVFAFKFQLYMVYFCQYTFTAYTPALTYVAQSVIPCYIDKI